MPSNKVLRPIAYFGGKADASRTIVQFLPPHLMFVEVFGGGGSVLLNKPRSSVEIYNDLDGEIVNVFRVMRDPELSGQLVRLIEMTPFSRDDYDLSYQVVDDPVERARRMVVRSWMSHGRRGISGLNRDGFRVGRTYEMVYKLRQWANLPKTLAVTCERLRGVLIENLPAVKLLERFAGPEVVFYLDPPYPHRDRPKSKAVYRQEMTDAEHVALAEQVKRTKGKFLISGYQGMYEELYGEWRTVTTRRHANVIKSGMKSRQITELLWISPNCEHLLF